MHVYTYVMKKSVYR